MKFYLIAVVIAILFLSCLKESIPDAMLASAHSGTGGSITATLSYELNGDPVNITVKDADNQITNPFYTLGCSKFAGYYNLDGLSSSGETTFSFYTDSLTIGNYKYVGSYGDMYFIRYNGENEYVHAASDSMNYSITSYNSGHISGSFSGQLTPLIVNGNPNNTYGAPSSIKITNGTFQNVPVFY